MNQGKRLLFYIVLNVIVSALTTLAILFIWDRPHAQVQTPTAAAPFIQASTPAPTSASTPAPAEPAAPTAEPSQTVDASAKLIAIDNVFGIGNLKDEFVLLKRIGDGELTLTGWHLDDGSGNTYTFPALTLYKNGAVQVHTAAGTDTVVDLYWGRDTSAWQVGKIVTLYDDQGNVKATYRIP